MLKDYKERVAEAFLDSENTELRRKIYGDRPVKNSSEGSAAYYLGGVLLGVAVDMRVGDLTVDAARPYLLEIARALELIAKK